MGNKRKCRHCKEYRSEFITVPLGAFCDFKCASAYGLAKNSKAKEKAKREDIKARKQALKSIGDLTRQAQAEVNKFVRIRDYGKPCISCGALPEQKLGGTMDAGHYRSRGAAGHLRFNLFNINSQCVKCNRYNSGNAVDYRIRLIIKIGLRRVERLENDNKPRTFSREYLIRVKKIFAKRARLYKKLKEID